MNHLILFENFFSDKLPKGKKRTGLAKQTLNWFKDKPLLDDEEINKYDNKYNKYDKYDKVSCLKCGWEGYKNDLLYAGEGHCPICGSVKIVYWDKENDNNE